MAQALKFGKGVWATKTGSSMAYSDTNDRYKPLPFNVERDSIATRVNKEGLIEVVGRHKLRIDYTDTDKGVALLENSATNSITYSEDFSQWTTDRVTVSENQIISPNGTLNADLIAENSENNIHRIYIGSITLTDNVDYTITVFAKKGTSNAIQLTPTSTSAIGSGRANFNLDNGVLGAVSGGTAEIKDYGNGWYRCSYSFEALATATSAIAVNLINDDLNAARNVTYLGNTNNNVYLWGAMLEQNSFLSSYIPTSGSTVQRAADVANNAGNSEVFNDSSGVLFLDIKIPKGSTEVKQTALCNGTTSEAVKILQLSGSTNFRFEVVMSSGTNFIKNLTLNAYQQNKCALQYKANDYKVFVNGFKYTVTQRGTVPVNLDRFNFNRGVSSTDNFYGKTKEIGYYDTELTDAELETLTSYRSLSELVKELNLNTL